MPTQGCSVVGAVELVSQLTWGIHHQPKKMANRQQPKLHPTHKQQFTTYLEWW